MPAHLPACLPACTHSPCRSEFAEHFTDAEGFGWGKAAPPVDVKRLIARKVGRCSGGLFSGVSASRIFSWQLLLGAGCREGRGAPLATALGSGWGKPLPPAAVESATPSPACRLLTLQSKEVERLNGVYGQILSKAGVEMIGKRDWAAGSACHAFKPCSNGQMPAASSYPRTLCTPQLPTPNQNCLLPAACCLPCPAAEGRGVVLDPHCVEVRATDGSVRQLRTKNILLATGGRAVKPPIPGAVRGTAQALLAACMHACMPGAAAGAAGAAASALLVAHPCGCPSPLAPPLVSLWQIFA